MPMKISEKTLNYQDKVYVYFDEEGSIQLEGFVSQDYYSIRNLIYSHFGKV